MKIAVFGAAGFVGQNVVQALREHKFEVVASDIIAPPSSLIVKLDLVKDADLLSMILKGCDSVVHLAASPLGRSLEEPGENAQVNIGGTLNILRAMTKQGVKKIIFASASSVVGDVTPKNGIANPMQAIPAISEDYPCTPKTPYAVAKLACEHYLRVIHELFGINYLIFRFFNVYGPGQTSGLIPAAYRAISTGKTFVINGDGLQVRDFVYVKDVSNFIVRVLTEQCTPWNETFNMGTQIPCSVTEVVHEVGQALGISPQIEFRTFTGGEISNYVADTTKLYKYFGAVPSTSFKVGLRETIKWLKEQ